MRDIKKPKAGTREDGIERGIQTANQQHFRT
jgi:hypothetical protein